MGPRNRKAKNAANAIIKEIFDHSLKSNQYVHREDLYNKSYVPNAQRRYNSKRRHRNFPKNQPSTSAQAEKAETQKYFESIRIHAQTNQGSVHLTTGYQKDTVELVTVAEERKSPEGEVIQQAVKRKHIIFGAASDDEGDEPNEKRSNIDPPTTENANISSINVSGFSNDSQISVDDLEEIDSAGEENNEELVVITLSDNSDDESESSKSKMGVYYNASVADSAGRRLQYAVKSETKSLEVLCKQAWDHTKSSIQKKDNLDCKMRARQELQQFFKQALLNNNLMLFAVGSTVNGCGSYNSDVDLCLFTPSENPLPLKKMPPPDRKASLKILQRIRKAYNKSPFRSRIKQITEKWEVIPAKVPIIKMHLRAPYNELEVDINVNNVAGIYNSHLIHYYSQVDVRCSGLALLVKHWAIRNRINDAMHGTLNSYSLILMVVHYLQCGVQPAVLPNLQHLFPHLFSSDTPLEQLVLFQKNWTFLIVQRIKMTLGELLVGFFHYFAIFNFNKNAISIRHGRALPKQGASHIYIEEPFDGGNTARAVCRIEGFRQIVNAFQMASNVFLKPRFTLSDIRVFA
ncbi:unnamed protein product [Caenorhabditis auriculariae]|uniref:PAP-associated domain-containing protein n=1 Tax=Caenorhabditis auriculariae TaxID=2777116 RepID=A0A8S1HJN1_9PELO|nr:unnamed protein product [Caenorhabditis auriculariae]